MRGAVQQETLQTRTTSAGSARARSNRTAMPRRARRPSSMHTISRLSLSERLPERWHTSGTLHLALSDELGSKSLTDPLQPAAGVLKARSDTGSHLEHRS